MLVPLSIEAELPPWGSHVHTLDGQSMGTSWQVRFVAGKSPDLDGLRRAIEAELDLVVQQMSHWLPSSDLCRFNSAPAGSQHRLPTAFVEVLDCALQVARASDGAFDPAAGALVNLWGFGPGDGYREPGAQAPDAQAIDAARACGGWQQLQLDDGQAIQPGRLQLDFSAIAKGHAVDRLSRCLRDAGWENHLVEVGGELRGSGIRPDGQPWWVALAAPDGGSPNAQPSTRVALHGLSVATSGDYLRFRQGDAGERLSHTLDPRSGWPIAHGLASVSVLHADCMLADAWSTALMVLGAEAGVELATRLDLAALFVQRRADGGFDETMSPALTALAA